MDETKNPDYNGDEVKVGDLVRLAWPFACKKGCTGLGFDLENCDGYMPAKVLSIVAGTAFLDGCMFCPTDWLVPSVSREAAGVIDIDKAAEAEKEAVAWLSGRFGFLEYAVDVSAVSEAGAEDFAAFRVNGTEYECSGGRLKVVGR